MSQQVLQHSNDLRKRVFRRQSRAEKEKFTCWADNLKTTADFFFFGHLQFLRGYLALSDLESALREQQPALGVGSFVLQCFKQFNVLYRHVTVKRQVVDPAPE